MMMNVSKQMRLRKKRSINVRILLWVVELFAVVCYDYNCEEYLQMLAFLWDMVLDYERDYAEKMY